MDNVNYLPKYYKTTPGKSMKPNYTPVTLDERARKYIAQITAPRTRSNVETALKAFYAFRRWRPPAPLAFRDMTFDVFVEFNAWLTEHAYAEQSKRTYLAYVTEYLRYAQDSGWLSDSFSMERAVYRKRKRIERAAYPIPQPSERIPEILDYYDDMPLPNGDTWKDAQKRLTLLRARAVVHVLYASAGRVSDAANLKRKQLQDGQLDQCVVHGKGNKDRYLYLTAEAQRSIRIYCAERDDLYEPLFISHGRDPGKPLSRVMLWKIVAYAARALGFETHPHEFRHYRATQLRKQGVPLDVIQKILGHSDISTTERIYTHIDHNFVRAEFDRASKGDT